MVNLIRMKLTNFIGVYLGMHLTEFEIDRSNSKNNIILMIGDNGSGKSSVMSEMTPFPLEHVGPRNKSRILPNKIGVKELDYLVDNYVLYKIKIIYDPAKTTKCFITKIIDDKEIDLNPNGNVESYLEVIEHELHMKKNYSNVGYLCGNGENKNFVAMKPTERNTYISEWMPEISDYLDAYRISSKILTKLKKDIDSYNRQIGNMSSINYELELNFINSNITNVQNTIRDLERKITQLSTYNEQIHSGVRTYQELNDYKLKFLDLCEKQKKKFYDLHEKYKNLDKISFKSNEDFQMKYQETKQFLNDLHIKFNHVEESLALISSDIKSTEAMLSSNEKLTNIDLEVINNNIFSNSELIKEISSSLNDFEEKYCNQPIETITSELYSEINSFINILDEKFIMLNNYVSLDLIKDLANLEKSITSKEEDMKLVSDLLESKQQKLTFVNNEIYKYEHGNLDTQILMKRPEFCINHDCGIVNELLKYLNPKDNVKELYKESEDLIKEINELTGKKTDLENSIKQLQSGYKWYDELTKFLYKNNEIVAKMPTILCNFFQEEPNSVYTHLNEIKMILKDIYEYSSLCNKKKDLEKSIEDLSNLRRLVTTNQHVQEKLNKLNEQYSDNRMKREKLLLDIDDTTNLLKIYEDYDSTIRQRDFEFNIYNDEMKNLEVIKHNLKEWNKCTYIYNSNKNYLDNTLNIKLHEFQNDLNELNRKRDEMTTFSISKRQIEKMRNEIQEQFNRVNVLNKIWSPKVGYPSWKIESFLNDLTIKTNEDMESMWGSELKIEKFFIDATNFKIIMNKEGNTIEDASLCSQGETKTINTAISFSIIESNIERGGYDVLRLDEVDGALDEPRRMGFIDMIQRRIDEMGCDSCFIITHNGEFEDIPCDIMIFKGAKIPEEKLQNKNVIYKYKG